jgi:predicted ArsR family transcriptional regulator
MTNVNESILRDVVERLDKLYDVVDEIARLNRARHLPHLRDVLVRELDTPVKRRAYQLTNGKNSRRSVAKDVGLPDSTVRSFWARWFELAIVEPSQRKGRPRRVISLEQVGIPLPPRRPKKLITKEVDSLESHGGGPEIGKDE